MKKTILSTALVLAFAPAANAMDIPLTSESTQSTGIYMVKDDLANKALPSITVEASIRNLTATDVETPQGTFTNLSIPGFQHTGEIGSPQLPVMNRLIEIPMGAKLEVKVTSSRSQAFSLADFKITNRVIPRQPPHPKDGTEVPFEFDTSSYQASGIQQDKLVTIEEIGQLRHVRLALLKVAPVGYDPVEGKLEVVNDLKIEITMTGADMDETAFIKGQYSSPFYDGVYAQTIRAESLRGMNQKDDRAPCFVIVADRQFEEQLEPFVRWKTEKGFDVVSLFNDTVGPTPSAIQAKIKDMYNNPSEGRRAPDFLLLVGDNDNLPALKGETGGWSSHITDLYYSTITDDYLPDILTGRFSARTAAELAPQLAKTMTYEKFQLVDASYLQKVVMIAGWDSSHSVEWGYPQINYGLEQSFNGDHGITTQSVFLSSGAGQNENEIHQKVSEGAAFVNYTAHGSATSWHDPSFEISDINNLAEGYFTFAVGNCCVTSTFQNGTCFGEAFLRAENKGAIGYIGASNNSYWDEDLWWGVGYYAIAHPNDDGAAPAIGDTSEGAYDKVFNGVNTTGAGMMVAGNLAVEQSNTSRNLYYWEIYHLLGDPSLMIYMGLPNDNAVQHASRVTAESAALEVKAAAGSLVGITVDGKLFGSAFVDESGVAQVSLQALPTEGTATIVVTGKNLKPYIGEIVIGQEDDGSEG